MVKQSTNQKKGSDGNVLFSVLFLISFVVCILVQLSAFIWLARKLCTITPYSIEATYIYIKYYKVMSFSTFALIGVLILYSLSKERFHRLTNRVES